ncbi:MAG: 3-deoxy-7-phosphoheptulonate synthase [Deltaproteobacteria bacterium]|nr:3-deoxy-7-phosphoheptulonate synthase [Deltaproteobacteria bacterium]
MVIVMDRQATEEQIAAVTEKVHALGRKVHRSDGEGSIVLGVVGEGANLEPSDFLVMDGVNDAIRISSPFKLASRTFQREDTIVDVDGVKIGGDEVIVMAGPCSVESEEQIFACAEAVAKAGGRILRGGAYKPRTSPYSFQGLGVEGLKLLRAAGDKYGLKVVTEVMAIEQIDEISEWADMFQVGARNMQNFNLLRALGEHKDHKPVLLKRGIAATIQEWLMSAEYILAGGTKGVVLCERGIRSYDNQTRNILDLSAVPVIKKLSHLPIVADPSHGTGIRQYVADLARASVAVGADGLMVEVHNNPDKALSDGAQSLYPEQFDTLMKRCRVIATVLGRNIAPGKDDAA